MLSPITARSIALGANSVPPGRTKTMLGLRSRLQVPPTNNLVFLSTSVQVHLGLRSVTVDSFFHKCRCESPLQKGPW